MQANSKVVVVTSKFAPHAGGSAMVWTHWCNHWPAENLQVIAPRLDGAPEYDRQRPFQVHRIGYLDWPKVRMPLLWLGQAWKLLQICIRQRPQIVHYGHIFENGFTGPLFRRFFGHRYCVHTYGEELALAFKHRPLRWLVRKVLKGAHLVTAISHYTVRQLREFGYHGPVLLVHPAVDTELYQPGPVSEIYRRYGLPPGPTLLTLGRLMPRKGHDRVIQALPQLVKAFPDLQYAIAGAGPSRDDLNALVRKLSLEDRVHFLGKVPSHELVELLRSATVFVHPNRVTEEGDVEGFGIVFLEAAACGIPVVGGASGGVPDSVSNGVSGYLIESQSELVDRITALLADEDLRQQMGYSGRQWALSFDWAKAARRVWEASMRTRAEH